jgi:endonuclease YncB( thermonuclease family)
MDGSRLIAASALLVTALATAQPREEFEGRVLRVPSGDTLIVERDGGEVEVRIANIGAPQESQFLAPVSRSTLEAMVRNRTVRVEVTGVEAGVRIYGHVLAGRLDVARAQVQRGSAWVCWDYAVDTELRPVESEARRQRRGVWRNIMEVTTRSECRRRPPAPPAEAASAAK